LHQHLLQPALHDQYDEPEWVSPQQALFEWVLTNDEPEMSLGILLRKAARLVEVEISMRILTTRTLVHNR
jgi:hypothetical protein